MSFRTLPLRVLIPNNGFETLVPTYGSGKLPQSELEQLAVSNPHSFIRVVKPQYVNAEIEQGTEAFYEASLNNLMDLVHQDALLSLPAGMYVYSQFQPESQRLLKGFVSAVTADSYFSGAIKKHENTLEGKEKRLAQHVEALNSVAEPVLLAQDFTPQLKALLEEFYTNCECILSVTDQYGYVHELRGIFDENHITNLSDELNNLGSLYIADGHHRVAAVSRYLQSHQWDFSKGFMSLIMHKEDLMIKSFHRIIKNVEVNNWREFLEDLSVDFDVCEVSNLDYCQLSPYEALLITSEEDYKLNLNKFKTEGNAVDQLEVSILEKHLFDPGFEIFDSKTDDRIAFMRGDTSLRSMKQMVKNGDASCVFVLPPNNFQQVMDVADQKLTMPPKSTWVEPKLLTGFITQQF